jgi:hypothetical protein
MRRLICHFWDAATKGCRASGYYSTPFKTGPGVTQGSQLLAKLFNIMVDAMVREWYRILREESDLEGEELDETMDALVAFFYVDMRI